MTTYSRRVLDHGSVKLLNIAGPTRRPDAPFDAHDRDPANSARLSFDQRDTRSADDDMRLNRYLLEHRHTTPFEMIQTWWEMELPIFVARQLVRHRTVSINEVSRRYVDGPVKFYEPAEWRGRAANKKQGSSDVPFCDQAAAETVARRAQESAMQAYDELLDLGVCPEQARIVLPVSVYTKWLWSQDLHNLLHMLRLRADPHAQWETRQYAIAMIDILHEVLPDLMEMAIERTTV